VPDATLLEEFEKLSARVVTPEAENTRVAQENVRLLRQKLDQYIRHYFGANVRINALAAWRVFQRAMSRPRLHAMSTAKSISGAMHATECDTPLLPPCQRQRPVSPGRVPLAQLAGLINAPAR
jgi:hypothetical protein